MTIISSFPRFCVSFSLLVLYSLLFQRENIGHLSIQCLRERKRNRSLWHDLQRFIKSALFLLLFFLFIFLSLASDFVVTRFRGANFCPPPPPFSCSFHVPMKMFIYNSFLMSVFYFIFIVLLLSVTILRSRERSHITNKSLVY